MQRGRRGPQSSRHTAGRLRAAAAFGKVSLDFRTPMSMGFGGRRSARCYRGCETELSKNHAMEHARIRDRFAPEAWTKPGEAGAAASEGHAQGARGSAAGAPGARAAARRPCADAGQKKARPARRAESRTEAEHGGAYSLGIAFGSPHRQCDVGNTALEKQITCQMSPRASRPGRSRRDACGRGLGGAAARGRPGDLRASRGRSSRDL